MGRAFRKNVNNRTKRQESVGTDPEHLSMEVGQLKKAILMMALEAALRRAAKEQPLGEPLDWMENVRPVRWRFGDEVRTYQWE